MRRATAWNRNGKRQDGLRPGKGEVGLGEGSCADGEVASPRQADKASHLIWALGDEAGKCWPRMRILVSDGPPSWCADGATITYDNIWFG